MMTILLVLVLVSLLGGGAWGYSRYGFMGLGPSGVLVALLLVLYVSGNLRF